MTEAQLKRVVLGQLRARGMSAEEIPVRELIKTADIKSELGADTFLWELKQRERVVQYFPDLSQLAPGAIAERVPEAVEYRNNHSSVIRDGVEQLIATIESGDEFRLLWLDCGEGDAELDAAQYEATLCGEVNLYSLDHPTLLSCYFFEESEFYSCRDHLDGAAISTHDGWKMILNPFSPRYERLKKTKFVHSLGQAAHDPLKMEVDGKILIADCDFSRREKERVLDYVSRKYGLRINVMRMHRYGGVTRVDEVDEA